MTPGIDPKVDYVFKKVFGSEANADLLRDLLGAVLGFAVSAVEVLNPFNEKETLDDKLSVLDIKARDAAGQWFNVEMQMVTHAAMVPRLLYYWAKLYGGQLNEGEVFAKLGPAYSVCFVNRRLFHRQPDVYLNRFAAFDPATAETLTDHFGLNIVELPKFTRDVVDVGTPLEGWCYYFRHAASLDPARMPATLDRPPIHKAMEVLMRMSQSEIERERYESRLKFKRDMEQFEADAAQARAAAAQARADAAQALENGMEKGREEGAFYGEIRTLQLVLKQPQTSKQELEKLSPDELQRLADELRRQVLPAS